jgi:hypothetical protein
MKQLKIDLKKSSLWPWVAASLAALAGMEPAWGKSGRENLLPNGRVFGCANCHVNPAGGGTRTPFGEEVFNVFNRVPVPATTPYWSATLAAKDSDGDGLANGREVGDPEGDGTAVAGAVVTNPGNRPPVFSSTALLQATMGLAYQYSATATDQENNVKTFSKASGPAWMLVATNGTVSGTPPDGSAGPVPVSLTVRDLASIGRGFSGGSTTQAFTLTVISSLAGWQRLKFNLPAETAQAAPLADPDDDGLPNLTEYAFRLSPKGVDRLPRPAPSFDAAGRLQMMVDLRDDDPKLDAVMETSDGVTLSSSNTVNAVVTDPVPGDGFKTFTFTDTHSRSNAAARYARLKLLTLP